VSTKGGSQLTEFEIDVADYDENRHFFLAHYFRETYDRNMAQLPTIMSGIVITRIELWITNKTSSYDNPRNVIAFTDIGETSRISNPRWTTTGERMPNNTANSLYYQMANTYNAIRDIDQVGAVLGDILVIGDDGEDAVIFCNEALVGYLCEELVWVAREKVKCAAVGLTEIEIPPRRFAAVNDTVASPRTDCVVGALCSLSREKAREAVVSGLVEVDFETEERPDRTVSTPCTLSVRGYGRFRLISVEDKTKKGRYSLIAEQYL
jgi:hypothetical protein